ncbi:MAG: ATP-binding protein [Clostridia bacterium]|nr:ATP-binding protein [Clostridia bacterium]
MIQNIHSEIMKEYDKRRTSSQEKLDERRALVYSRVPRIQEIDSSIQLTGIRYNKLILSGDKCVSEALSMLQDEIDALKREKAELLAQNGFPADFLTLSFYCGLCHDSGFINGEAGSIKCTCYKQLLIDKLYSYSNLQLTDAENFSTFDETFYPEAADEAKYGIKISPRENIRRIRERCLSFVENFSSPDEKNLFFCGPTGVGKTFMSNCIALEVLKKGYTVLYQTSPVLFNRINEYRTKSFKDEDFEDIGYRSIFDADLLIIDDLGTEPQSAARYAELLNILNTRYNTNLGRPCKTIISSNLSVRNLYEYYTERVASRIVGNFDMNLFAGQDIRTAKKLAGR